MLRRGALAAAVLVALAVALCPPPSGARPGPGTVIRLPFPRYDGTLTPYTFELGYPLVTLVYDTLFWRGSDGLPRPWLAHSVQPSNGGRRLTLTLRSGLRWTDGRPLTAEDVAFTFSFVASHFHPRFTPELAAVQRVRATGPLTVTIDLRHVSLGFEDQPLSDLPILPKHLWQRLRPGQLAPPGLPVGSGPYRLVSASPFTGYVFDANDAYFLGTPRVRQIRVPLINHEQQAYDSLSRGQLDMLPFSLPGPVFRALGGTPGLAFRTGPLYSGTALLLNLRRAPFDSPAARRAVADALDLSQIASHAGPASGAQQGYIDPVSPWASGTTLQRFDPSLARADAARLRLPMIHVLAANNDPVRLDAGNQVVLALQRVGIHASLTTVSGGALSQAVGENGSAPTFEAAVDATPALPSYDPDFLAALFGSDPRAAPLNFTGYRSRAFDALAERVAATPDAQARHAATRAELRLLARDLPVIPLFFSQGLFAYRPLAYSGWVFVEGTGILDKRSFLPGQVPTSAASNGSAAAVPAGSGSGSGSGFSFIDIASLVAVAIVLILGTTALLARRSGQRD